jgi:hypothetical protein
MIDGEQKSLYPHQWIDDPRQAIFSMNLPLQAYVPEDVSGLELQFYLPSVPAWNTLFVGLGIQLTLATVLAIPLYYQYKHHYLLQQKASASPTSQHHSLHHQPSLELLLLGYGFVAPFWFILPKYGLHYFQVQNLLLRFAMAAIAPTLSMFRTIAIVHNYIPVHATVSAQHFVLWYVSPILLQPVKILQHPSTTSTANTATSAANMTAAATTTTTTTATTTAATDTKNKSFHEYYTPTTLRRIRSLFISFMVGMIVTGLYQSLFDIVPLLVLTLQSPSSSKNFIQWFPFLGSIDRRIMDAAAIWGNDKAEYHDMLQYQRTYTAALLDPYHWIRLLLYAQLLSRYLFTHAQGLRLATECILRIETQPVMCQPLYTSQSPSDFWGAKWNLLVHDALKNGIYKPIRFYYTNNNMILAMIMTFIASGCFHEGIVDSVFGPTYPIQHGPAMRFFMWQAMLIMLEMILSHVDSVHHFSQHPWYQQLVPSRGSLFRSLLIVWMGIPFSYGFLEPYVRSELFPHGSITLPTVKLVVHYATK